MEFRVVSDLWRCVWWKTELPRIDECCESPSFCFNANLMKLRLYGFLSEFEKCENWKVNYAGTTQKSGIETLVYIENKSGELKLVYCGKIEHVKAHSLFNCGPSFLLHRGLRRNYGIADENTISMFFVFDLDSTPSKNLLKSCSVRNSKNIQERPLSDTCLLSLSDDMNKLFNKEEHSDVILRCGDRRFFANKQIISARSDVFATMFRTVMSERETGVVDIVDMEWPILEQFLRFIYSGKINDLSMESVFELYRAGDKYDMPSLKQKCASFIIEHLSQENFCQVLLLADIFGDAELSDRAESFAVANYGFLKSDVWTDFAKQHATVAIKVYIKFHQNKPHI